MITMSCTDCSAAIELTTEQVIARAEDAAGAPPLWCDGCLSNHDVPTTPVNRPAETVPVPSAAPLPVLSERQVAPIVQLVTRQEAYQREVHQDVVTMLEGLLERARRGDLTSLAFAATTDDGGIATAYTKTDDRPRMLGAIAYMQHRYAIDAFEVSVPFNPSPDGDA